MSVNLHGISREAFDLIVNEEVSGRAAYDKKYARPEKPGGQSGVTVGIGYDCGYATPATIRRDWAGKIPDAMIEALAGVAGIKGDAALAACARVRGKVLVPWEAAIDVFSNVSIPKYLAMTRKALPGFDDLSPDCKGSLLSVTYNRGASYTTPASKDPTGRYREMREIRAAIIAGKLAAIPGLLRSMARLWTTKGVRGVALRREHEARLFEKGLKSGRIDRSVATVEVAPDPAPIADEEIAPPNVQPLDPAVDGDPVLLDVQQRLKARRYPPGVLDGKWGSGTRGALNGFMGDRGHKIGEPTNLEEFHEIADEVRAELLEAETEVQPDGSVGWYRPVSQARATGDPKIVEEIAPEVVPARRGFLASAWAAVLTFLTAIWTAISDKVQWLFGYVSDNKDSLPTDPGYLSIAWGYVTRVPPAVWVFAGAIGLSFIAVNIFLSARKITEDVKTGARQ